jgi:hypothetical protein
MTTARRRAALGGIGAVLLVLVAVTCVAGALVPDILSSVPERVLFGVIALVAAAGAVTLVVDLVRGE